MKNSYFDGGLATYIGTSILATLITVFTLGICAGNLYDVQLENQAYRY